MSHAERLLGRTDSAKWVPEEGDLVVDTAVKGEPVGCVAGVDGAEVILRPLGGGKPWRTADYRPAELREELRAKLAEVNRRRFLPGSAG
ncbi:hypothetical protein [Streptomyces sp. UNOC14_S4]|uniref:hypothetical protein n=1 Tax=Streptomyces sp. UNOC14_S4 TaxID=2872340 RepID=UPI001E34384E|nr:hypothetical protein [Streptomyces sp. UNOC14_S4]MCC3767600.1 hypothetical protein [Streptomyces sp. UNOC14_S4]